ncbi:MAG: glutaredoxin family protein [Gammaproteobacteria bacterium]|nr:glutaredoxin family protein [Gammaproteobacteria bacterium]
MSRDTTLTLYYRSGCSLCEQMEAELLAAQSRYGFRLQTVDVDGSAALVAAYGHKVPVLTFADGAEICHYFLDHSALAECLSSVSPAAEFR